MRVWISRSQPGASRQGQLLEEHGFEVLVAPVLRIEPTNTSAPAGRFQHVVFLSEHSVRHGGTLTCCVGAQVYTTGPATAAILAERGVTAQSARQASSEGLLELFGGIDMVAQTVLIVAGEGGRKTLRDGLTASGAIVEEWLCYRRCGEQVEAGRLAGVNAVLVASQDGFRHLARLWFEAGGSAQVDIIAASERIAGLGNELGFHNIRIASSAATEDWIAALNESND